MAISRSDKRAGFIQNIFWDPEGMYAWNCCYFFSGQKSILTQCALKKSYVLGSKWCIFDDFNFCSNLPDSMSLSFSNIPGRFSKSLLNIVFTNWISGSSLISSKARVIVVCGSLAVVFVSLETMEIRKKSLEWKTY